MNLEVAGVTAGSRHARLFVRTRECPCARSRRRADGYARTMRARPVGQPAAPGRARTGLLRYRRAPTGSRRGPASEPESGISQTGNRAYRGTYLLYPTFLVRVSECVHRERRTCLYVARGTRRNSKDRSDKVALYRLSRARARVIPLIIIVGLLFFHLRARASGTRARVSTAFLPLRAHARTHARMSAPVLTTARAGESRPMSTRAYTYVCVARWTEGGEATNLDARGVADDDFCHFSR